MRAIITGVIGSLASWCGGSDESQGNVGYGPFLVSSQSPGQSLRLGLMPRAPSLLSAGSTETYVADTWTNTWVNQRRYQLDFERMNVQAALAYSLTNRLRIEGAIISQTTFGGWQDAPIESFNRAFALNQNGRDQAPRGRTLVHIDPTGSQPGLDLREDALHGTEFFGRASSWYTMVDGDSRIPTLALTMALQAPLQRNEAYHGGYADVGIGLSASKRFGAEFAYAVFNYTRYGPDHLYGIQLHRGGFSGLAALELELFPAVHPIAQYLISQGIAPDYYDFSKASHEVTFGLKARMSDRVTIELAALENVFVFDNSADFGIHIGGSSRW